LGSVAEGHSTRVQDSVMHNAVSFVFGVRCLGPEHPDGAWSVGSEINRVGSVLRVDYKNVYCSDGGSLYTGVV